ncbi:MAG: hypothetical protein ACO3UU_15840 [Minisyncoccia bacterium]
MATYRFNYLTNENNSLEENYESSENIKNVKSAFINYKGNVMSIQRIDILEDPDEINTDEALGYIRR